MKKIFFILIIMLAPLFALSQTTDVLVKKLVEKNIITDAEATVILKETTTVEVKSDNSKDLVNQITNIFNSQYVKVGGYSQLLYTYDDLSNVKHDFSVRNAFIALSGKAMPNLSYWIMYNFSASSLTELYVTWTPSEYVGVRAGQQKIPLGIENNISLSKTEFIQNTLMMTYLLGGGKDVLTNQNGKNNTGRDFGINLFGNLFSCEGRSFVEYTIGLYQGSGMNSRATRSNKDFVANVFLKPIAGLKIGGGAYFGEAKYSLDQAAAKAYVRNRWIASAEYKLDNKLTLRSEYVRGYDAKTQREGGYAMANYSVLPYLQLGAQVEYLNMNRKSSAQQMDYVGGANFIMSKNAKLMLNYTYSDFSKKMNRENGQKVEMQLVITY